MRWVDKNPVSISQVNNYILMNIGHVYNGKVFYGYELFKGFIQERNRSGSEMLCHVLWMKSPHLQFMPWISVPCNAIINSSLIMCEYPNELKTDQSSNMFSTEFYGTRLGHPLHICEKYWTQIDDMCYRMYDIDAFTNDSQMLADMPNCIPIPDIGIYAHIQYMSNSLNSF